MILDDEIRLRDQPSPRRRAKEKPHIGQALEHSCDHGMLDIEARFPCGFGGPNGFRRR
jgi:hypothetical protein